MRLTGGQIVADYLIDEGVRYVFAIPEHGNTALLDAFVDRKDGRSRDLRRRRHGRARHHRPAALRDPARAGEPTVTAPTTFQAPPSVTSGAGAARRGPAPGTIQVRKHQYTRPGTGDTT